MHGSGFVFTYNMRDGEIEREEEEGVCVRVCVRVREREREREREGERDIMRVEGKGESVVAGVIALVFVFVM